MPDIRHAIQIAAPPDVVFPLVSTGDGFTKWWAEDVHETDGKIELGFFNRATIYRLRAMAIHAPSTAQWMCETGAEWEGTQIAFSIEPVRSGVLLGFLHSGWRDETPYYNSCNTTWGGLMFRLKGAAEGQGRGPLFRRGD